MAQDFPHAVCLGNENLIRLSLSQHGLKKTYRSRADLKNGIGDGFLDMNGYGQFLSLTLRCLHQIHAAMYRLARAFKKGQK